MKSKLIVLLLVVCSFAITSCEKESEAIDTSVMESPFVGFEYDVTSGRTYVPSIDNENYVIYMANVSDGEDITAVRYQLEEGVSIYPDPVDRVGVWRDTELFILSKGDVELPYEVVLVGN